MLAIASLTSIYSLVGSVAVACSKFKSFSFLKNRMDKEVEFPFRYLVGCCVCSLLTAVCSGQSRTVFRPEPAGWTEEEFVIFRYGGNRNALDTCFKEWICWIFSRKVGTTTILSFTDNWKDCVSWLGSVVGRETSEEQCVSFCSLFFRLPSVFRSFLWSDYSYYVVATAVITTQQWLGCRLTAGCYLYCTAWTKCLQSLSST